MRQLQYAEDVVKKGFTGFQWQVQSNDNFTDEHRQSVREQIDYIFNKANNCRKSYNPIFEGEKKILPTSDVSPKEELKAVVTIVPVSQESLTKESKAKQNQELTKPPMKQILPQDEMLNAVLIGLGVFVVLKILS